MSRPLSLVERLEQRIDDLAAGLLVRQAEAFPGLAPAAGQDGAQVLSEARALLRSFFASLHEGGTEPSELEAVLRDGTRRAGDAVPLDDLLAAYHQGGEALWAAAAAEAHPGEERQLVELARHLLHWQGLLARVAAQAFVRELRHADQGTQAARRVLADLLLAGGRGAVPEPAPEPPDELLERAGVRIPAQPVVLAFGAPAVPQPPGAAAESLQASLEDLVGEPVLMELTADGGTVLLPAGEDSEADVALAAMEAALGAPLLGGAASAQSGGNPGSIPAAAREARELLRLALALELPPGVYRRGRLLLEHALSARRSSLEALAELLTPLQRRPNLITTLETWFANDFERGATSAELAVHRNTLDYRLRRVGDLTGLALDSARGLQTAGAALLARRLLAAETAE